MAAVTLIVGLIVLTALIAIFIPGPVGDRALHVLTLILDGLPHQHR